MILNHAQIRLAINYPEICARTEKGDFRMKPLFTSACVTALFASTALAQTYTGDVAIDAEDVAIGQKHYSPYLDQSYPNRVFFGDTHTHTSYSTDAGSRSTRSPR